MSDVEIEAQLKALRELVIEQGNIVRRLKDEGKEKAELAKAVAELKERKKAVENLEKTLAPPVTEKFDRDLFDELMKRRFFFMQAFEIYGGVAGLFDFGPPGCAIKTNVLRLWRSHFVLEEQMLEVECTMLTPYPVLDASGHVERFRDFMVRDVTDPKLFFRADHILEWHLEKLMKDPKCTPELKAEYANVISLIDNYGQKELAEYIRKYDVRNPDNGNKVDDPTEFNLMFATSIGPEGHIKGFLRPETAQGIFVNFKRLLEFNNGRTPFAAAQIGPAFRNEISPRSGLLRVREFTMAEIEYFTHPEEKYKHHKFHTVADVQMNLFDANRQLNGEKPVTISVKAAVESKLISNEAHAYFLARIHQFLIAVGIRPDRLRFRQHLPNEMAHYACDCWDAECLTSYGWIECVGCADRSAYDLTRHSEAAKIELVAQRFLAEPRVVKVVKVDPVAAILGKTLKQHATAVRKHLEGLKEEDALKLRDELAANGSSSIKLSDGSEHKIDQSMVKIEQVEQTQHHENFTPIVIEPSFGIGRIIYALLEQNFFARAADGSLVTPTVADEAAVKKTGAAATAAAAEKGVVKRTVLSLPPSIAPVKVSVLPLSTKREFDEFVTQVSRDLTRYDVSFRVDSSSTSIGRRYSRMDELAVPFGITVDFETIQKGTVSVRDRDTTKQLRVPLTDIARFVHELSIGVVAWADAVASGKYPIFETQDVE